MDRVQTISSGAAEYPDSILSLSLGVTECVALQKTHGGTL